MIIKKKVDFILESRKQEIEDEINKRVGLENSNLRESILKGILSNCLDNIYASFLRSKLRNRRWSEKSCEIWRSGEPSVTMKKSEER